MKSTALEGIWRAVATSVAASVYCSMQSREAYVARRAKGSQRRGLLPFMLAAVISPATQRSRILWHMCAHQAHLQCRFLLDVQRNISDTSGELDAFTAMYSVQMFGIRMCDWCMLYCRISCAQLHNISNPKHMSTARMLFIAVNAQSNGA